MTRKTSDRVLQARVEFLVQTARGARKWLDVLEREGAVRDDYIGRTAHWIDELSVALEDFEYVRDA